MANAAASNNSITVWKEKFHRAKNQIQNMREEVERGVEMMTDSVVTATGGAVNAVLESKMPKLPGTEIDSGLALGALACGLASFGGAGDYSRQLNCLGSGILAVEAYKQTQKMLAK